MKTRIIISLAAVVTLFTACLPSVNPFYQTEDVQFDARLLGAWQMKPKKDSDDSQNWRFETGKDKSYALTVTDQDGKRGIFSAHLFKLSGKLFLDMVPEKCEFAPEQNDLVAFAMTAGHLLVRVYQLEPSLKIAFFDFDWTWKFLENNPQALAHRADADRPLLTASTPDLQKFVLQHDKDGELFGEAAEFVREK